MAMKYVNIQLEHHLQPYSNPKLNLYLKEIKTLADINKPISFHTARHTFAYNYISAGGNVVTLQQLLGHSNIQTTMVYTHVDISVQEKEIEKMNQYFSTK
jgi:site-specific recombinase XerD